MTTIAKCVETTHTYWGNSEVNFFTNEEGALTVTIDTERLHVRSVECSDEDCNSYTGLFGDSKVMEKYSTGISKTREEMTTRVHELAKKWRQHDPYSGLAVFKEDTFIGHVILGYGDKPGQAELAYLFDKNVWQKGFGTEAVTAVVKEYAPATVAEGYTLEGEALNTIIATSRPDNPASIKILEKVGMKKTHEETKFGALRHHFSINMSEISKKV